MRFDANFGRDEDEIAVEKDLGIEVQPYVMEWCWSDSRLHI